MMLYNNRFEYTDITSLILSIYGSEQVSCGIGPFVTKLWKKKQSTVLYKKKEPIPQSFFIFMTKGLSHQNPRWILLSISFAQNDALLN